MSNNSDWLSEQALEVLARNCDQDYADSKRYKFEDQNRFEVLVTLNMLDSDNMRDLADKLKIPFENLRTTT